MAELYYLQVVHRMCLVIVADYHSMFDFEQYYVGYVYICLDLF